jgi:TolB-like protein
MRKVPTTVCWKAAVRKAGNRLRITGQLIEAETGAHLWADRFDGGVEDVFEAAFGGDAWSDLNASVLAEIADAVTDAIEALEARLGGVEQSLPRRWQ